MPKFWLVQPRSLTQLEGAIRSGWRLWTADPLAQPTWSPANPAWGQCACTGLVVQDMVGGQLLMAEVRDHDGSRQGFHYWNSLSSGMELDLTREQFTSGEVIGEPRMVERPADVTCGRLAGQYHLLKAAVASKLEHRLDRRATPRPVSVKGVCFDRAQRVLLCRNWREQWELPGGRPEVGEPFDHCLERELREETGLVIQARHVIDTYTFEVQKGAWVDILVYGCLTDDPDTPIVSAEHRSVAFLDAATLPREELPAGYARAIAQWRTRAPAQA